MNPSAQKLIDDLQLSPHPEGGYFAEIYRSAGQMASPPRCKGSTRSYCTTIHYLLQETDSSSWHRLHSDEQWFYTGGCQILLIYVMNKTRIDCIRLGDVTQMANVSSHAVIPANHWFAAKLETPDGFALTNAVVSPGFEFRDFELAREVEIAEFKSRYPNDHALIDSLVLQGTPCNEEDEGI